MNLLTRSALAAADNCLRRPPTSAACLPPNDGAPTCARAHAVEDADWRLVSEPGPKC